MTRFLYPRKEQQMHYPVDVFIGKIRDYDGSRLSAIAKANRRRTHADRAGSGRRSAGRKENPRRPDRALCHYPVNTGADWILQPPSRRFRFAPRRLRREFVDERNDRTQRVYAGDTAGVRRYPRHFSRALLFKLNFHFAISDIPSYAEQQRKTGWLYRVIAP